MGEEINFAPISNYIITTCLLEKMNTTLYVGKEQPKIKEIQRVVAVGPRAEVKVGDWVLIDHSRFIKHVKVKSTIRAGVGGEDMIKEEFVPPFVAIPGVDEPLLKITDREIEGTIPSYDKLPAELKEFTTMKEYEQAQKEALEEAEKNKKKFQQDQGSKEVEGANGPMVIDSTRKVRN